MTNTEAPAPDDARYRGPVGGFVIPGLTGVAASGLVVAAWAVDPLVGPLVLLGGAFILGLLIGNPGNEAVVLAGNLLPGALLLAFGDPDGCVVRLGFVPVVNVVVGIGLMFGGLVFGLRLGRRVRIPPVRRPVAVGILAGAAVAAISAWLALGSRLASGNVC